MRYLKTFENFGENNLEKTAEMLGVDLSKIENAIDSKFESLSEEQKEDVYNEMNKLATTLGLTMEQMTDPFLVDKKIKEKKTPNLLDLEKNLDKEVIGESKFIDNIKKFKNKVLKGLAILGATGTLLGILMAGYKGDVDMSRAEQNARFGSINPSEMSTIGGIVSAISLSIAILAASLADWKKQGSAGPRSF